MDKFNEVESALSCFEKNTDLRITIHDLHNQLTSQLNYSRFCHSHSMCSRVKNSKKAKKCIAFEIDYFHSNAASYPKGRLHRCHAGVVEMALPVFENKVLIFVLYVGPFNLKDHSLLDYDGVDVHFKENKKVEDEINLESKEQLSYFWECLYQLAARLRCYVKDESGVLPPNNSMLRKVAIQRFIDIHHNENLQLKDLAKYLHLSPERCRHVVQEECGLNFSELLRKVRIKTACSLLSNTDYPLNVIAENCGLKDLSGFSRAFQKIMNNTPAKWRRLHRG